MLLYVQQCESYPGLFSSIRGSGPEVTTASSGDTVQVSAAACSSLAPAIWAADND